MLERIIASPYDREHLVIEIHYKNHYIAEINREKGPWRIEFYTEMGQSLDLKEFFEFLEKIVTEELPLHK